MINLTALKKTAAVALAAASMGVTSAVAAPAAHADRWALYGRYSTCYSAIAATPYIRDSNSYCFYEPAIPAILIGTNSYPGRNGSVYWGWSFGGSQQGCYEYIAALDFRSQEKQPFCVSGFLYGQ